MRRGDSPFTRLPVPALLCVGIAFGQWISIGPWGGDIQALALDPNEPQRLWAVSYIYPGTPVTFRSSDGGASWDNAGTFELPDVTGLVVDPHDGNLLYACSRGVELWRSSNGGEKWEFVVAPGCIRAIAPDPHTRGRIYAAGFFGVQSARPAAFLSTDSGLTWDMAVLDTTFGALYCCQADPQRPGVVYAGGDSGRLYRSTDAGATWHERNSGLPREHSVASVAVSPADPEVVVCGSAGGLYRSRDAGGSWASLLWQMRVADVEFSSADSAVCYVLARDTSEVFLVSQDTGVTWTARPRDTGLSRARVLAVDPEHPGTVYTNVRRGVLKTTDSGWSWRKANRGLNFGQVYTVGVNPRDTRNLYVGAHDTRVFRSVTCGDSWSLCAGFWCIENGMCCAIAVAPEPSGDVIYAFEGSG